jgi:hypothetical protein
MYHWRVAVNAFNLFPVQGGCQRHVSSPIVGIRCEFCEFNVTVMKFDADRKKQHLKISVVQKTKRAGSLFWLAKILGSFQTVPYKSNVHVRWKIFHACLEI